ncbi:hypothetical protein MKEN_00552600 [Mycena kentingensis (nom. inval.)]|nr:hypothetical protein MKEN_00552600 [Mycena kentingensis (nom. inval.)]
MDERDFWAAFGYGGAPTEAPRMQAGYDGYGQYAESFPTSHPTQWHSLQPPYAAPHPHRTHSAPSWGSHQLPPIPGRLDADMYHGAPSRHQYGEPSPVPVPLPTIQGQVDLFLDTSGALDDWRRLPSSGVYGSAASSSHSVASSPAEYMDNFDAQSLYSATGRSTPYSDSAPGDVFSDGFDFDFSAPPCPDARAEDDASGIPGLPSGSPLKFAPRPLTRAPPDAAAIDVDLAGQPETVDPPNDVDPASISNFFDDCTWRRSNRTWLDEDVWSEYITFSGKGISLTGGKLVRRLERVHGLPSQLPTPPQETPTAFLISVPKEDQVEGSTVDNLFRGACPHSFDGSTGKPSGDTTIAGRFFPGRSRDEKITVRRAVPHCVGLLVCESLDLALIKVEQRDLVSGAQQMLVDAQLRMRERQGSSRVGYEELDKATEARLAQGEISGDLRNMHNSPAERQARSTSRQMGAAAIAHRTRGIDDNVRVRRQLVEEAKEALQAARAQALRQHTYRSGASRAPPAPGRERPGCPPSCPSGIQCAPTLPVVYLCLDHRLQLCLKVFPVVLRPAHPLPTLRPYHALRGRHPHRRRPRRPLNPPSILSATTYPK